MVDGLRELLSLDRDLLRLGLLLAWAVLMVVWLTLDMRRALAALRLKLRFRRARRLERRAITLLHSRGYELCESQARRELWLEVDGERRPYQLRADALVRDGRGGLHVAEVKSGRKAPDPLQSSTRRQLLEYQLAYFECEGVLLVDIERRRIRAIRFPDRAELAAELSCNESARPCV